MPGGTRNDLAPADAAGLDECMVQLADEVTVLRRGRRTGAARTITTGAGGTFAATGLVTGGPYTVLASNLPGTT